MQEFHYHLSTTTDNNCWLELDWYQVDDILACFFEEIKASKKRCIFDFGVKKVLDKKLGFVLL